MSGFWDTDRLLWLREGWEGGESPSDMARAAGVTRNVIIGKIHRLQKLGELSHRADQVGVAARQRVARVAAAPKVHTAPLPAPKRASPREPVFDDSMAKTPDDIDLVSCHWPIGDPQDRDGFRYCGQPGYPYCEGHAAKGHQPTAKPRKRKW